MSIKRMALPLCAALVAAAAADAVAQATSTSSGHAYPTRPVRFIVPFSPGGASDTAARIVGAKLGERWGQQVVIENRPGAGGTIGTEIASKAQPDGYTLLMGSSTELASNPNLYTNLKYDTTRAFTPIALLTSTPLIVGVHPSVAAQSVKELVALARARPGQMNYASSGNGSTTQLAAEMLKRAAGIEVQHIPYTGSAPAVASLLGGQTQWSVQAVPALLPHVKAGKVRALAITNAKRIGAAPDLPTLIESGYPVEIVIWNGLVAPTGTPKPILARVSKDALAVMTLADVRQSFANQGAEITPGDAEQLGAYIRSELAKYAKVIKEAGVRID
jgi:tripartite-type tricarboxylate transporter receptor subunit TctC